MFDNQVGDPKSYVQIKKSMYKKYVIQTKKDNSETDSSANKMWLYGCTYQSRRLKQSKNV